MAPHVFFVSNTNHHVVRRIDAMFIMVAICISIELYEIVDRASHFALFYVYCACICAKHKLRAQVLTFANLWSMSSGCCQCLSE